MIKTKIIASIIVISLLTAPIVQAELITAAGIILAAKVIGWASIAINSSEAMAEIFDTKFTQNEIQETLQTQIEEIGDTLKRREEMMLKDPEGYKQFGFLEEDKALAQEKLELQQVLLSITEGNYIAMIKRLKGEVINIAKGYAVGLVAQGGTEKLVNATAGQAGYELTEAGADFVRSLAAHAQVTYDAGKAVLSKQPKMSDADKNFYNSVTGKNPQATIDASIMRTNFKQYLKQKGLWPKGGYITQKSELEAMVKIIQKNPKLVEDFYKATKKVAQVDDSGLDFSEEGVTQAIKKTAEQLGWKLEGIKEVDEKNYRDHKPTGGWQVSVDDLDGERIILFVYTYQNSSLAQDAQQKNLVISGFKEEFADFAYKGNVIKCSKIKTGETFHPTQGRFVEGVNRSLFVHENYLIGVHHAIPGYSWSKKFHIVDTCSSRNFLGVFLSHLGL